MSGLSVLVVEDEAMIAMMIEEFLEALGFAQFGCASSVEEGQALLAGAGQPDMALLDRGLGGEFCWPVARRLVDLGIPFAFMTGAPDDPFPEDLAEAPRLAKPFTLSSLEQTLADLAGRATRPVDE